MNNVLHGLIGNTASVFFDDILIVIKHFPQPTSVEKERSFLGLTGYYRKFIRNYADIAQPLSSLLKKNTELSWEPTQTKAFETLQEKLRSSPVLIFLDYTKKSYCVQMPLMLDWEEY